MKTPYPIVLASQSPRRQQFLRELGVPFTAHAADIDERTQPGETPTDMVQRLSTEKAAAVAQHYPAALIIAADTIVVLDGTVLGKPADAADARRMLANLRGRAHYVHSAVSLLQPKSNRRFSALSSVTVRMRNYTDDEIDAYIATGDPLDKAGAYAIQNRQFAPVACWEGCYASVMGFPLADVALGLAQFGINLPNIATVCSAVSGVGCCAAW